MLAQLLALGRDPHEIAETLGIPLSYISLMKKSALFLTKVQEERDKFIKGKRIEAEEEIAGEWLKSVRVLASLRDNSEDERVILQAASKILDKGPIFERKQVTEKTEVKVNFTQSQEKLVQAVIAEDDGEDKYPHGDLNEE